jgi:hypothetical protein
VSNAALAGLPRMVGAAEELRWRGTAAVGLAVAAAGFWLLNWLLGQSVDVLWSVLGLLAAAAPAAIALALTAPRRVDRALDDTRPPPRASLYETSAAARERRIKLVGIVVTAVVVLLALDRLTGGGGVMAALVAGLAAALGTADLRDATRFVMAEQARGARLFLMIPANALSARFGTSQVYEEPQSGGRRLPTGTPHDLGV